MVKVEVNLLLVIVLLGKLKARKFTNERLFTFKADLVILVCQWRRKKEKQQSVTYERYENLFQQATNMQNPTKKETALNYLKSVKEWLDQQQQNWIWFKIMLNWMCKWSNIRYTKAPERSDSLGLFFQVDVAFIDFTSCFGYSTNNWIKRHKLLQEGGKWTVQTLDTPPSSRKTVG